MSRLKRWGRRGGWTVALIGAVAGALQVPDLLRELDAFRVLQVEVVGTRFLEPYAVVRAAGLEADASVFDDRDAWKAGVLTLPLVEEVRVTRTLPSSITLEVREVEPVALVAGPTLRPVDGRGRLLELDPAGTVLDLPILTGLTLEGGRVDDGASAAAVATVTRLLRRAPEVADEISHVELRGSDIRVGFRASDVTALLPAAATGTQLTQLRLALADLVARGELEQVRSIDVRFRDQVVVSFLDRAVMGS